MRLLKLNNNNQLKQLIHDTLIKLTGGAKSITISTESLTKLPNPPTLLRPNIHISETAYAKMKTIVDKCSEEIAWHGTVSKLNDLTYAIQDILIYPQKTTAMTVESDDEHYAKWLDSLDDDTYNSIRMQGHSHVNMSTSPSAVDTNFYETITKHITDYYIFIILNKKGSMWVNLYDIENNVVYETHDINIGKPIDTVAEWYEQQYALHVTGKNKSTTTTTSAEEAYLNILGRPYNLQDYKDLTSLDDINYYKRGRAYD